MQLQWSDALLLGIDEMDRQHKRLVETFAAFLHQYLNRGKHDETRKLLEFLSGYALEHFNLEDRLMTESQYPGTDEHRAEHRYFLEKVNALRGAVGDLGPVETKETAELIATLRTWLLTHMKETDRRLERFLTARRHGSQSEDPSSESRRLH